MISISYFIALELAVAWSGLHAVFGCTGCLPPIADA
jgi:hypothetical protein